VFLSALPLGLLFLTMPFPISYLPKLDKINQHQKKLVATAVMINSGIGTYKPVLKHSKKRISHDIVVVFYLKVIQKKRTCFK
jgi:hypothetical protein